MAYIIRRSLISALVAFAAAFASLAYTPDADAANVIKRPGQHAQYDFELEPHGIWSWA